MRKICKILFILLCMTFAESVLATNCYMTSGDPAGIDISYTTDLTSGFDSYFKYEITHMTIKDNRLYLLGWAFQPNLKGPYQNENLPRQQLGTNGFEVSFRLRTEDGKNVVDFQKSDIKYAVEGDARCSFKGCNSDPTRPKFYNLTYWTCVRSKSGMPCLKGGSVPILGGFSASIDLSTVPKGKNYVLQLKYSKATRSDWINVAVAKGHIDSSINSNKEVQIDGKKVKFNDPTFNSKVDVNIKNAVLSGTWNCDTGSKEYNTHSYNVGEVRQTYSLADKPYLSLCDGGTASNSIGAYPPACDHSSLGQYSAGTVEMYPINVNGDTAYVPAIWFNFNGKISLNIDDDEPPPNDDPDDPDDPGEPFTTDPNRCVGKDVYSVYYLLQHGLDNRKGVSDTSRSLNLIADKRILEIVTGDPTKGFEWIETQGEGIVTVVNKASKESEMSLEEYFNRRYNGPYDKDLMYNEGRNYYVKHSAYQSGSRWRDSATGCDLIVAKGTENNPLEFKEKEEGCIAKKKTETVKANFSDYKKVAISVAYADIDTFEGNKQHNQNNGLVVKRKYDADKKYLIADPTKNMALDDAKYEGRLQQPLVYRWDICLKDDGDDEPETPDCSDDFEEATCVEGEEGTSGYFRESDDLKTCTLSKNADSGFLIVEEDYCTVGCKDDIDALLPSYKYTKAGQFFKLDNNIPTVTGKRTCVTSKIDYDKYDQDLKTQGDEMIKQYNTSKDYQDRAGDFDDDNVEIMPINEKTSLNTCCDGKTCLNDDEAYAIYVKNGSSYNSVSDLNGKVTGIFVHDLSLSLHIKQTIYDLYPPSISYLKNGKTPMIEEKSINTIQELLDKNEIDAVLIQVGAAKALKDVRVIEGSGTKWETKEYTHYKWKVPARTTTRPGSGIDPGDMEEKTGDYGGITGVSCQNGVLVETEAGKDSFEEIKDRMENAAKSARNAYLNALREYKDIITSFNKCFSWTDKSPVVRNIGEDNYSIENARGGENFEYKFDPDVTFSYDDPDSFVFGNMPFSYKSQNLNKKSTDDPEPKRYYWDRSTGEMNEKYSKDTPNIKTGYNDTGFSLEKRKYINCYGKDVCTTDSTIEGDFYSNTSYIKREEQITYEYHLPQIYTLIPSGKMSGSDLKPNIPLPSEAVPVNINTNEGLYDYYISVKNISDTIRRDKSLTKGTDTFEDRYASSGALGTYEGVSVTEEGYVCHYQVENEIYIPRRDDDPNKSKLGEINFFYRPVDTYDISHPNNYPLGPNWTDARAEKVIETIRKDAEDYQELIKEEKGRFTFTLTPTVMKQIRYYNGEQAVSTENAFADFNLSCYDKGDTKGYHCYSPFLSCLVSAGQNKEGSDQTKIASCESIFKNTLNNYDTKYGYSELKRNRENLIKKQEDLDRLEEVAE